MEGQERQELQVCGECEYRKCTDFVIHRKVFRCTLVSGGYRVGKKAICYHGLKKVAGQKVEADNAS